MINLRKIFCNHSYKIKRWHWFHGYNANEPRMIEVECICKKCGKIKYFVLDRNMDNFADMFKELEER